ncbi:BREX-1 system phosphatase PglZ type A [Cytobacillus horneckiae]|uniref:BREX-1 system phosphatase PglZ type A n=1 Tax=Cytobacillus horneckiae TaxID=549687 RepID=A0A2N0ZJ01_9BACI|nr:BREX-1 system phosphatase PglZ type A [Cytobacillus horneckiae]MEC1159002.1 BREX-1 system phosphatase PglZ type A [Cytobacillus horneckiae]MED2937956.1 BREX-1 system phosphatase PglZ type A [Cytobacillus horneckiae]PKG29477.1 BREX-1 system phosphatase PglZ type A [Cytobacillus horneckiae]
MNVIEKLQEKIQREKETKKRAIVFWYDPQAQASMDELKGQLEDIEVRQLTNHNFFQLKVEIELQRSNESFLIYSDEAKPNDKENMLLDLLSYSTEFKADETAMLSETLQVSDHVLRPMMEQYPLFFGSKERKRKLSNILPKDADDNQFELSMMAVLVRATVPDIRVITRQLLLNALHKEENELLKQLERNYSLERALESISRHFGVSLEKENEPLVQLLNVLIYQHFRQNAGFTVEDWEAQWTSSSPNICALFVEEFLQHDGEVLEEYIKEWEKVHKVRGVLSKQDIENYQLINTFPVVDVLIIEKCIDELVHQTIHVDERLSLIGQRLKTYWGSKGRLKALFETLFEAIRLEKLKPVVNRLHQPEDLYESYATYLYEIDHAYRHFMHNFTNLDAKEMLEEIASHLTNWYENEYLRRTSEEMNFRMEDGYVSKLMPQRTFFSKMILPILEKEQTRVFVIISDALRYEAAYELHEQLKERENGKSSINSMAASYPTYTQLGMASLLPYRELVADEKKGVLADGQSTKGTDNRRSILQSVEPQTEVLKLKELLDMKASEADHLLKGKRLVYLYHDHIDALGDSVKSERETYGAVHQAIQDLQYAVDRLSRLQAKRIFITADHGFLFQFKQIENHGKIPAVEGQVIDHNRRFAIGHKLTVPEGSIKLTERQTPLKNVEVVLAKGINRFKTGGGLQFIHGGALPQEAVVPLIDYRRIEIGQPVDIVVAMINKVITNYRILVSFYQEQSISDNYTSRKVHAAFYQGDERISNEIELVFNLKGENRDRNRQVSFNLVEKHYKIGETCTLRIKTITKKGKEPYLEEEFVLRLYEALY